MLLEVSVASVGLRVLERYVVVGDFGGVGVVVAARWAARPLVEAGRVAAAALGVAAAAAAVFAAPREQGDVADHDFRAVDLFAAFLVVPAAGGQATFRLELVALFHVVADDFSELAVGGQIVPFGAVLPVPLLVLVALAGRDGKVGDGLAAGQHLDLRVFAYIAQQNYLVYTFCHKIRSTCPITGRKEKG